MRFPRSLKEALFGVPEPVDIQKGIVIINPIQQSTWIKPATTFREQIEVFNKDALIRQACLRQAAEIIGAGYFPQIDENYKVKLPTAPYGGEWDALEAIKYFDEINNMDEVLQTVAVEIVAFGNSFLNVTNGIKHIPLEAIEYAKPRTKEIPIKDEYNLKTTATYNDKILNWESFIHFRANATTSTIPFGEGIVAPLMRCYTFINDDGDTIEPPTPLELRHSVRRSMMKGFEKFSFGNEMWSFPEASDPTIETLNTKVKDMKDTGQRVVTNTKGTIQIAVPQRTTSYDEWLKTSAAEFNGLLEDPALKIATETIFAKATAEEETKLFQKKVLSMQRILKRQVELLWKKCLKAWGFNPVKAKPRLNFGSPTVPEYNIIDILKAVEDTVISKDEARQMLREARWKIVEGEAPKDKVPEPKPIVKEQASETASKSEKIVVLEHKPLKLEVTTKQEPLKVELIQKPQEFIVKQETQKIEVVVKQEPLKVEVELKEPQKDPRLEQERVRMLKKLLEKLEKR